MDSMKQRLQSRMNKIIIFPLLLSLSLILHSSAAAFVGGWSPISDVKDPHVVEIGEFAVSEYDRQSHSGLKFETVVRGETQVVAGTNYRLVVAVTDGRVGGPGLASGGGASKNYEAIVWEQPWLKSRNLTSFKPAINGRFL